MLPVQQVGYEYNNFTSNTGYPQLQISPIKQTQTPSRQEILIDILSNKLNTFIKEIEQAKLKLIQVIKGCSDNNIFTIQDKTMNFDDYTNYINAITKNYLSDIKNHHKLTINLITQESSEITNKSSSFDMQQMCDKCQILIDKELIQLDCFHSYHQKCLSEQLKIQINNNCKTLRCLNCQLKIKANILKKLLSHNLIEKMLKEQLKSIRNSYLPNQIYCCKKLGCNYFCIKTQTLKCAIRCQICESVMN